jgi:uncharacterized paraquat-inducible protein A
MKQIKTIRARLDNAEIFDEKVNAAIAEGWELKRRDFIPSRSENSFTMLYAELERETITEAERCCENCAHFNTPSQKPPCCDCSEDCDKWEEVMP